MALNAFYFHFFRRDNYCSWLYFYAPTQKAN